MKIRQLASRQNLELAWRRITSGNNQQYKRFYRDLYYAYEVAVEANLRDLRSRLLGGTFVPSLPERIYVPKSSGLHRPLSLLGIEDQIVLQAFANLAAKRLQPRRAALQFKVVFSNILEKPGSIFFFRHWQQTYRDFEKRIAAQFQSGMRWVGDFDLAAYYDTISHELLLRTIYPRTTNSDLDWLKGCLRTWSSESAESGHGHGLPQGPLASALLAEYFLLPIDLALQKRRGYARYVDDVRLLGATEDEVRADLIELERRCRERGLVPQSGKFSIHKAQTEREVLQMLPSIAEPQYEGGGGQIGGKRALSTLRSGIRGKPGRVVDKTRLRYVLFRARPDSAVLKLVLRLIKHHPEHTDAFFVYLGRFGYRKPIEELCLDLVANSPYAYVRGEAWHVLARYRRELRAAVHCNPGPSSKKAIGIAKRGVKFSLVERWGAAHFLCVSDQVAGSRHSRLLKSHSTILQALLAPGLPDVAFASGGVVRNYLQRRSCEPGLSVCSEIHRRGLRPASFGLRSAQLPSQISNVLRELGVISKQGKKVDPIGEALSRRYGLAPSRSWHNLLGGEYVHALGLLKQAEAAFDGGYSYWLSCQNSFNQTVFLALQRYLRAKSHPAACTTINSIGELIDFGVTLDAKGPFSKACPNIADCFRAMNARRNGLPGSHPYTKKTIQQTRHLKAGERNKLVSQLRTAYADFAKLMP